MYNIKRNIILGIFVLSTFLIVGCSQEYTKDKSSDKKEKEEEKSSAITKTCIGVLNESRSEFIFVSDESGQYLIEYTWFFDVDTGDISSAELDEQLAELKERYSVFKDVKMDVERMDGKVRISQNVKINENNIKELSGVGLIPLEEEQMKNIDEIKNLDYEDSINIMTRTGEYECK